MSQIKKGIRKKFRESVLERDGNTCMKCKATPGPDNLDAHHITDRNEISNGGYVPQNGITLCKTGNNCHLAAEKGEDGLSPDELYELIDSSFETAHQASLCQSDAFN